MTVRAFRKKSLLSSALLVFFAGISFSQVTTSIEEYRKTLVLNILVPGTAQIALGQQEGYWYLGGTAAMTAGTLLNGPTTPDGSLENVAGALLLSYGSCVTMYSSYAYFADMGKLPNTSFRESMLGLLYSPFSIDSISSPYVLPLVGVTLFGSALPSLLSYGGLGRIDAWYGQDDVGMWGINMNPWLATSLYVAFNALRMEGTAIAEETLFRGLLPNMIGDTWSTVFFGASHMSNLVFAKKIDSDTLISALGQTLSAACVGAILSDCVSNNDGNLSEAVALHYWWNVMASSMQLLEYIVKAEPSNEETQKKQGNISYGADVELDGSVKLALSVKL